MRFPVQWGYWTCIRQREINRTCNSQPLWPRAAQKRMNAKWSNNAAPELCEASSAVLFLPAGPPSSPASSSFSLDKAEAGRGERERERCWTALHLVTPRAVRFANLPTWCRVIVFIITRGRLSWRGFPRGWFGPKQTNTNPFIFIYMEPLRFSQKTKLQVLQDC